MFWDALRVLKAPQATKAPIPLDRYDVITEALTHAIHLKGYATVSDTDHLNASIPKPSRYRIVRHLVEDGVFIKKGYSDLYLPPEPEPRGSVEELREVLKATPGLDVLRCTTRELQESSHHTGPCCNPKDDIPTTDPEDYSFEACHRLHFPDSPPHIVEQLRQKYEKARAAGNSEVNLFHGCVADYESLTKPVDPRERVDAIFREICRRYGRTHPQALNRAMFDRAIGCGRCARSHP
jgi:hypothetical protein